MFQSFAPEIWSQLKVYGISIATPVMDKSPPPKKKKQTNQPDYEKRNEHLKKKSHFNKLHIQEKQFP